MQTIETTKKRKTTCYPTRTIAGVEYWSAQKAAEYLGITKQSVLNYARRRRLTKLRLGGIVLFKQEDLNEFINESTDFGVATRK